MKGKSCRPQRLPPTSGVATCTKHTDRTQLPHNTQAITIYEMHKRSEHTPITGRCVLSCPRPPPLPQPQQPFQKSRRLKQTLLCFHFINSLNSRVSLNNSCAESIRRPHCSILFERSPPKITMSSLRTVEKTVHIQSAGMRLLLDASVFGF